MKHVIKGWLWVLVMSALGSAFAIAIYNGGCAQRPGCQIIGLPNLGAEGSRLISTEPEGRAQKETP